MGILKRGWAKGIFLLFFVGGFLGAGIVVNHYLFAKAAGNKPINQQKTNQSYHLGVEKAAQLANGSKVEKELIRRRQNEAYRENRQKTDQETSKLPENNPANNITTPEKPAANNEDGTKPPSEPGAGQSEQNTQPANTSLKTVYLTFDDGPESFSGEIIALLEQYHFKATFFMLDGNIRRYPDSARLMVKMGETVGLHGVTHNAKLFYATPASVLGEMNQDRNTLKEITGVDSVLIRTPYGSVPDLTPEEKKAVFDNGYLMWDWNIDSKDWYYRDARFVDSVIAQLQKRAGKPGPIVILMHEKKETLAQLPKLLDYLSKQQYECKAIDSTIPPIHF
ncbi:polysaccharide deacetylase family protein [Neobacillus ginsengisoli]|uniref:Peptidoglycan/xylan/chitin deacetylase (PgdA/CDA1 family) n=1 Tax=Neobacillus ginsengisoli TaxID=904295 RepID=A0ABT9XVM5_9BACI|nr:polysaccharide deacetylase family protein [Neobacillus ginsengisoli]MDQ0198942.1 peptidoglycan/xylan/chitin deacetylase (PgdA/CDA1 family) [Neobacillus ginsengisoli]